MKPVAHLLSCILMTLIASNVCASAMTFEDGDQFLTKDIDTGVTFNWGLLSNYHGFHWTNMLISSEWPNATKSDQYVVLNSCVGCLGEGSGGFSRTTSFTLTNAYVTAYGFPYMKAHADGFGDNGLHYSKDFVVLASSPTKIDFGWDGIKSFSYYTYGNNTHDGTYPAGLVFDNVNVTVSAVPEPSIYTMFATGLVLLALVAVHRRKLSRLAPLGC